MSAQLCGSVNRIIANTGSCSFDGIRCVHAIPVRLTDACNRRTYCNMINEGVDAVLYVYG